MVLLVGLAVMGCTKMDDQFLFRMEYDEIVAIPAGLNTIETYTFVLKDIPTNYQILLQTNNLSDAAVNSINPGSARLTDELNQLDFSRFERISLLASNSDFKNEKEIAYLEVIPLNSTNQLQLFPTLVNARDLFAAGTFNLRLKVKLRGFLTSSANIRMRIAMSARKP